jgi:hypothetical protein
MRLPAIKGLIRRRLLVTFRVDAKVMGRFLPPPFRSGWSRFAPDGFLAFAASRARTPLTVSPSSGTSLPASCARVCLSLAVTLARGSTISRADGSFKGCLRYQISRLPTTAPAFPCRFALATGAWRCSFALTRAIRCRRLLASSHWRSRLPTSRAAALATPSLAMIAASTA